MKRTLRSTQFCLAIGLGLLAGGCSTAESAKRAPTVAIALNIAGGGRPTPEQAALVQQSLAGALAKSGMQLARRADEADYIVTATLTPDAVDPTKGHLKITRIEPAPGTRITADSMMRRGREAQETLKQLEDWSQSMSSRPDYDLRGGTRQP